MKYFINTPYTAESLKAEFRTLSLKLHPDTGGDATEFADMLNEYEQIASSLNGTRQHAQQEQARQQAEERRREREEERREEERRRKEELKEREEEQRRERERIEKAQEKSRAAVRAWSAILERIPAELTGKARASHFDSKKAAASYVAATKRNIKRVINHYFPGLEVKVSISGEYHKEGFTISWEDGPTKTEIKSIPELDFFISSTFEHDPYADYGDYNTRTDNAPWREAYGGSLGDCTGFDTVRTLSEEGMRQAADIAAGCFKNFEAGKLNRADDQFESTADERHKFAQSFGVCTYDLPWYIKDTVHYVHLCRFLRDMAKVNVQKKEKAPEFAPKYGATYKAVKKAMGSNVFCIGKKSEATGRDEWQPVDIFTALLDGLQKVKLCNAYDFDGCKHYAPLYHTSYTTEYKRREKFAAVGIELSGSLLKDISPELREALSAERAAIEQQRREWNAQQESKKSGANKESGTTTGNARTPTEQASASPLLESVADILHTFANIMQQAQRWEGVTVPAEQLERWKKEATEGTKSAAARLCEVCACLASLTPDSRKDFDALGTIFWVLSEQIKNGAAPSIISNATSYALAQLFDLIDRTQTPNQARAIREAHDPKQEAGRDPTREAA